MTTKSQIHLTPKWWADYNRKDGIQKMGWMKHLDIVRMNFFGDEVYPTERQLQKVINDLPDGEDKDDLQRLQSILFPSRTEVELEGLIRDKDWHVRIAVARHKKTPEKILEKLSDDEETRVRKAVVRNKSTTEKILEKLSRDGNWEVRCEVANNPTTSGEILEKLSDDESWCVKGAVVRNNNTPIETLKKLGIVKKT